MRLNCKEYSQKRKTPKTQTTAATWKKQKPAGLHGITWILSNLLRCLQDMQVVPDSQLLSCHSCWNGLWWCSIFESFLLLQVTTHLSVLLWINSIKLTGSTISWMLWYKYIGLTWVSRYVCCISPGKALSYNVWNNSEITKVSNGTCDLFCVILTRSPTHPPTMRTHKARGLMWNLNSLTFSYIVFPNNKSKLASWCSESCCQQSRQQLDWRQSVQKKSN